MENKLIYSYEVARFDGKGKFILRQLFKAYYENPRQMPPKKLEKLEKLIKKNYAKYGIDIKLENGESIHKIKFNSQDFSYNVNPNNVDNLVKMLKLEDNIVWGWFKNELIRKTERNNPKVEFYIIDPEKFIIIFKGTLQCILDFNFNSENLSGKFQFFVTNEEYKEVLDHVLCENLTDEILLYLKCYLENHHAYLRVICNYISEMTDNYAELEYKKLYM